MPECRIAKIYTAMLLCYVITSAVPASCASRQADDVLHVTTYIMHVLYLLAPQRLLSVCLCCIEASNGVDTCMRSHR